MRTNSYLNEEELMKKAIMALVKKLGPVETYRFMSLPRKKRLEFVKRHRVWQAKLNRTKFFDEVFGK